MSAGIFLRGMIGEARVPLAYGLNLRSLLGVRPYITAQRVEETAKKKVEEMRNKLNFEQFQRTKVESIEDFKNSPEVRQLFDGDIAKISQAYKKYCESKYNRYLQSLYGGNPATMF